MNKRIDKTNYYLNLAETVTERSTCLKRKYGAIIVKNDAIISTGFNGASRGVESCLECGYCLREKAERGTDYSNCLSVHAEQNCIIHASREQMIDSDLYLVGLEEQFISKRAENVPFSPYISQQIKKYVDNPEPCALCKRMIINSGIKRVIVRLDKYEYKTFNVNEWVENKKKLTGGY